jgi:hypothetical protein
MRSTLMAPAVGFPRLAYAAGFQGKALKRRGRGGRRVKRWLYAMSSCLGGCGLGVGCIAVAG